jgi:hypothetical protein
MTSFVWRPMKLSDFSADVFSQGGEDGAIAEVFRRLGEGGRTCVEFGAGDGISCSNTANLWQRGWNAILIESDPRLVSRIEELEAPEVRAIERVITPGGADSIDEILAGIGVSSVDLMSIDVDGADYWIFLGMIIRPRLIVIEFNPTVPPHLDIVPASSASKFGVGALTMRRAAKDHGYQMIGITHANMFLVRSEDAAKFADLDTDLSRLLPPERFMYLATDYRGNMVPIGARPEWGLVWPPSKTEFAPNTKELLVAGVDPATMPDISQIIVEVRALRDRFEAIEWDRKHEKELAAKELLE